MKPSLAPLAALGCAALCGCTIALHGTESVEAGSRATSGSSAVAGSARVAQARLAFSSGSVPAREIRGARLVLDGEAAALVVIGLVLADLWQRLAEPARATERAQAPARGIAETCSCYRDGREPAQGARDESVEVKR